MTQQMTLNEYQDEAAVTRRSDLVFYDQVTNGALGISDEAGEVAGLVKKFMFQGHPLNSEKLVDEMGDVLWYIADLATTLGVTLEEVAVYNVGKLRRRYNGGGFSAEASVNRTEAVTTKSVESQIIDDLTVQAVEVVPGWMCIPEVEWETAFRRRTEAAG